MRWSSLTRKVGLDRSVAHDIDKVARLRRRLAIAGVIIVTTELVYSLRAWERVDRGRLGVTWRVRMEYHCCDMS